jgi:hypothetical protein
MLPAWWSMNTSHGLLDRIAGSHLGSGSDAGIFQREHLGMPRGGRWNRRHRHVRSGSSRRAMPHSPSRLDCANYW